MSTITISSTATIRVPMVPNYVFDGGTQIRVGDLSDATLRKIGRAWTDALIARARQQRKERP